MNKYLRVLTIFILTLFIALPMGVSIYVIEGNSVDIQSLYQYITAVEDGTQVNFAVATEVFRSHKESLERLYKESKKQKGELEAQNSLTQDLKEEYDLELRQMRAQLAVLTYQITVLEAAIAELTPDTVKAAQEVMVRYQYNQSLEASVFVYTEYFDPEDANPKKDKEGKVLPFVVGSGSGTMLYIKGGNTYILTAAHVVDDYQREGWVLKEDESGEKSMVKEVRTLFPTVTLHRYHLYTKQIDKYTAKVVSVDRDRDLALLEITGFESKFLADIINKKDIQAITLHDEVYVTGCPLGVTPRVSRGRITAWIHAEEGYIESDCDLIWGNSGGAMFRNGKVIGVVSRGRGAMYQMVESLGLCISPNLIHEFLNNFNKDKK